MKSRIIPVKLQRPISEYEIRVGHDLLDGCGEWAKNLLSEKPGRTALVSNRKIFGLFGDTVKNSLVNAGFQVSVCLIGDGEKHKNFQTLRQTLEFFGEKRFSRSDTVIALGGGVVGDLAGFAASIYLRGITFLQIPTTLLAMIDSSVGGKTAVNSGFGKNLIGSFYQPNGVLADIKTLGTLPKREVTAGFCEAVKQGAVGGEKLFDLTAGFLEKYQPLDNRKRLADQGFLNEFENLLAAHINFKVEIVRNDEREAVGNTDKSSRKILNFGHTLAHSLEKVTDYRYLKHGEAVGYGIMFAALLSKKLGLLPENQVKSLNDVVHRTGKLPSISHIDPEIVFDTFKYDKKLVNDSLHWILLNGIGKPIIFPHANIPHLTLMTALEEIIEDTQR
ncbi:MAG: 3-dehydroquinate synthase [Pyrinomonadaceae bacterium]